MLVIYSHALSLTSIENLAITVDLVHSNRVLNKLLSVHFDLLLSLLISRCLKINYALIALSKSK